MAEMAGSTRHESVPVGVPRELARPGRMLLASMEMALGVEMRLGAVEAVDGAAVPTAANVDAVAAAMMSDLSMSNFPAVETMAAMLTAVETMAAMLTAVAAAVAATSALRQSNRRARKRGCGQEQNGCGEGAEPGHAALLIDHLRANSIQLATTTARSASYPGCGAAQSAASGVNLGATDFSGGPPDDASGPPRTRSAVFGPELDDGVGRFGLVRRQAGQIRVAPVGQIDNASGLDSCASLINTVPGADYTASPESRIRTATACIGLHSLPEQSHGPSLRKSSRRGHNAALRWRIGIATSHSRLRHGLGTPGRWSHHRVQL
jgi:hypothetical protein